MASCYLATRTKEIHDGVDQPLERFPFERGNLGRHEILICGE
jgi:hypothetical protein